jgi:hypothetical protein
MDRAEIERITDYIIYNITKDNWHLSARGREKVLGELEKIELYLTKGDLAEL